MKPQWDKVWVTLYLACVSALLNICALNARLACKNFQESGEEAGLAERRRGRCVFCLLSFPCDSPLTRCPLWQRHAACVVLGTKHTTHSHTHMLVHRGRKEAAKEHSSICPSPGAEHISMFVSPPACLCGWIQKSISAVRNSNKRKMFGVVSFLKITIPF